MGDLGYVDREPAGGDDQGLQGATSTRSWPRTPSSSGQIRRPRSARAASEGATGGSRCTSSAQLSTGRTPPAATRTSGPNSRRARRPPGQLDPGTTGCTRRRRRRAPSSAAKRRTAATTSPPSAARPAPARGRSCAGGRVGDLDHHRPADLRRDRRRLPGPAARRPTCSMPYGASSSASAAAAATPARRRGRPAARAPRRGRGRGGCRPTSGSSAGTRRHAAYLIARASARIAATGCGRR